MSGADSQRELEAHHERLRDLLERVGSGLSGAPWSELARVAVGGLTEVGWSRDGAYIMVVSGSGRGLIDPSTGSVVARDRAAGGDWYDAEHLEVLGIGPTREEVIRVAGLWGGGLAHETRDGWGLEVYAPRWPFHDVVLSGPGCALLYELSQPGRHLDGCRRVARCLEFRGAGFAPGGRFLALATGDGVRIYGRSA